MQVNQLLLKRRQEILRLEGLRNQYSKTRVFQQVRRYQRRRAASYNVKRLPRRFRQRALEQMQRDQTMQKKKTCPRITFRTRQGWLESHIWHAKRFRMHFLWGRKLGWQRNQKSCRMVYRMARDRCTLHDASYYAHFQLSGTHAQLLDLLDFFDREVAGPGSRRFSSGRKHGTSLAYAQDELIGPVNFLWHPEMNRIWLWIHPSASALLFSTVQSRNDGSIDIQTLNTRRLELGGPKSHQLLAKTLWLAQDSQTWDSISALMSPGPLPPGTVIALTVHDPRLRFPISKNIPGPGSLSAQDTAKSDISADAHISQLWDRLVVEKLPEALLNQRRAAKLVPGTLDPLPTDAQIPILLLKREYYEGWDVILPEGWTMPFWNTFVYAGAIPIGVSDRRAIMFERGVPAFPFDFASTLAFDEYHTGVFNEAMAKYERTPPSKKGSPPLKFERISNIEYAPRVCAQVAFKVDSMRKQNPRKRTRPNPGALGEDSSLREKHFCVFVTSTNSDLTLIKLGDREIGRVTTSQYSFKRGNTGAIAYVSYQGYLDAMSNPKQLHALNKHGRVLPCKLELADGFLI